MYREQIHFIGPVQGLKNQSIDADSFNNLCGVYQKSLFGVAMRILDDNDLAWDATQEAMISAFYNLKSYRGGSLKSWLMRIVTNACYDELRRQKRHPVIPLELSCGDGEEIESPAWLADSSRSMEEKVETGELKCAIQRCLDGLSSEFRTVVILIDIQGMDYKEVADATKVPLGTVKSRLSRARLRMKRSLQGFGDLLPVAFRLEKDRLL